MTAAVVVASEVVLPGSAQLAPYVAAVAAGVALCAVVVSVALRWWRRRHQREGEPSPRPWMVGLTSIVLLVTVALTIASLPPKFTTPEFPPIGRLFPEEAFFYRTATDLPAAADSESRVAAMDGAEVVADFGGQPYQGIVWGIPFNPVDATTPLERVRIREYPDDSYLGEYPISDPAYIESMPSYGVDNHYVALDREAGRMWELFATTVWFGRWEASSGALWDLDELTYPDWSTIAARLPLLPGVISFDEIERGRVDHVVHATADAISSSEFVWPAKATDGRNPAGDAVPMGAWLRLRDDVDLDALDLGPQARVIAEGLREYGLVITDSSPVFSLRGTPDARWDRADLATLRALTSAHLEMVDPSGVVVSPDSMAVLPPS